MEWRSKRFHYWLCTSVSNGHAAWTADWYCRKEFTCKLSSPRKSASVKDLESDWIGCLGPSSRIVTGLAHFPNPATYGNPKRNFRGCYRSLPKGGLKRSAYSSCQTPRQKGSPIFPRKQVLADSMQSSSGNLRKKINARQFHVHRILGRNSWDCEDTSRVANSLE